MQISISNVIINYFLTHSDTNELTYDQLNKLVYKIKDQFCVDVIDHNYQGVLITVNICNDFLTIDNNKTIHQSNILDFLEQLEPVYQHSKFQKWEKEFDYYKLIRQF